MSSKSTKPGFFRRLWPWGKGKTSPQALHYVTAEPSRSKSDWWPGATGPNSVINTALPVLVARHRDLVRNNGQVSHAVRVYVNALINSGLRGTADSKDDHLNRKADEIWHKAGRLGELDLLGLETFYGLQQQIVREMLSGQVLIRRVWDRSSWLGMRLQIIEGEQLDRSKNGTNGTNRIAQGIETTPLGRVVAYWIFPHHPNDHPGYNPWAATNWQSIRVSAEDIVHIRMPGRAGALQGEPITAPVAMTIQDIADFNQSTLIQKKTESLIVGVVTREPYSEWNPAPRRPQFGPDGRETDPDVLTPGVVDAEGSLHGTMRPGTWLGIENGSDVKFNTPQISNNYAEFQRTMQLSVAAGLGLSYEQFSGDFSGANYSTMRAGMLQFWAHIDSLLWGRIIPSMHKVWGWVMESAWLSGHLPTWDIPATWSPPSRPSIEPDKDLIGLYMAARAGWVDEDDIIASFGYNPTKLREKLAQNRAERERLGITSDADPADYAWRGATPATWNDPQAQNREQNQVKGGLDD